MKARYWFLAFTLFIGLIIRIDIKTPDTSPEKVPFDAGVMLGVLLVLSMWGCVHAINNPPKEPWSRDDD